MARFEIAYPIVAGHEGGYQAHPNDKGNRNSLGQLVGTNWGISAPVYEAWIGKPPSKFDMSNMSKQTAMAIFQSWYWNRIKGNEINNQYLANLFFDGAVNHGVGRGVRLMQKVLGVGQDGIVGSITLGALNSKAPDLVYNQYKSIRTNFYRQLAASDSTQKVFLSGWLKRINSFRDFPGQAIATGGQTSPWSEIILLALVGYTISRI